MFFLRENGTSASRGALQFSFLDNNDKYPLTFNIHSTPTFVKKNMAPSCCLSSPSGLPLSDSALALTLQRVHSSNLFFLDKVCAGEVY